MKNIIITIVAALPLLSFGQNTSIDSYKDFQHSWKLQEEVAGNCSPTYSIIVTSEGSIQLDNQIPYRTGHGMNGDSKTSLELINKTITSTTYKKKISKYSNKIELIMEFPILKLMTVDIIDGKVLRKECVYAANVEDTISPVSCALQAKNDQKIKLNCTFEKIADGIHVCKIPGKVFTGDKYIYDLTGKWDNEFSDVKISGVKKDRLTLDNGDDYKVTYILNEKEVEYSFFSMVSGRRLKVGPDIEIVCK